MLGGEAWMTARRTLGCPLYVLFINVSNALFLSLSITVTKTRGLSVRKREIMTHVYKSLSRGE
jgi:hypothetical protein